MRNRRTTGPEIEQQRQEQKKHEKVTVTSTAPAEELDAEIVLSNDGQVRPPAFTGEPAPKGVPEPHRYRVVKGGPIQSNGHRAILKVGKELDDLNYNIVDLKRHGIVLEAIDAEVQ